MSSFNKKAGQRRNRQKKAKVDLCDVTLNDFANSSVVTASKRLKKNKYQISQVVKEVKQLNLTADNQTWEEKLDVLEVTDNNDDEEQNTKVKKIRCRRRKQTDSPITVNDESGINYPIDIWFLISEHINPENVGKFAAICKTTLAVVSSAKFWFNLYKRYYRRVPTLPYKFQPECMVRRYKLRTNVIRALHFMYPPFISKVNLKLMFNDPHILKKRLCVSAGAQRIKKCWLYCFKLKQIEPLKSENKNIIKPKPQLLELLGDISANEDDNCKVLQVVCLNYIILPMLYGQILHSISLNVSQGMHHKLQLNFGSGPFPSSNNYTVILEPAVHFRILDWWDPWFPHSDGITSSLYSEIETKELDDYNYWG